MQAASSPRQTGINVHGSPVPSKLAAEDSRNSALNAVRFSNADANYAQRSDRLMHSVPQGEAKGISLKDYEKSEAGLQSAAAAARRAQASSRSFSRPLSTVAVDLQKKDYDALRKTISFQDMCDFSVLRVKPMHLFYQAIIPRAPGTEDNTSDANLKTPNKSLPGGVRLVFPDTFVFGVEDNPTHFYTDAADGKVGRRDNVPSRQIAKMLTAGVDDDDAIVAVLKKPTFGDGNGNDTTLLGCKALRMMMENPPGGPYVIQRFVRCRGRFANICRVQYFGPPRRFAVGYFVSNVVAVDEDKKEPDARKRLTTVAEEGDMTVTIYRSTGNRATRDMEHIIAALMSIAESCQSGLRLSSMVCDFIRDEMGTWQLLQIKSFDGRVSLSTGAAARTQSPPSYGSPRRSASAAGVRSPSGAAPGSTEQRKLAMCKSCLTYYDPDDLCFSMTLKMIHDTELHLSQRGVKLDWFSRRVLPPDESPTWYRPCKVCKSCFDLYSTESKLAEVTSQFAKMMGIAGEDPIMDGHVGLQETKSKLQIEMENKARSRQLLPQRLVMAFYGIRDFPMRLLSVSGDRTSSVEIVFEFLGQNVSLPVPLPTNIGTGGSDISLDLPLNKMRLFHFFTAPTASAADDILAATLRRLGHIRVSLVVDGEMAGNADLSVQQFVSGYIDRLEYNQAFLGLNETCQLYACLGILRKTECADTGSLFLLQVQDGVYIPQDGHYCAAEPLPEDWVPYVPSPNSKVMHHLPTHQQMHVKRTSSLLQSSRPGSGRNSLRSSRPASSVALAPRSHSNQGSISGNLPMSPTGGTAGSGSVAATATLANAGSAAVGDGTGSQTPSLQERSNGSMGSGSDAPQQQQQQQQQATSGTGVAGHDSGSSSGANLKSPKGVGSISSMHGGSCSTLSQNDAGDLDDQAAYGTGDEVPRQMSPSSFLAMQVQDRPLWMLAMQVHRLSGVKRSKSGGGLSLSDQWIVSYDVFGIQDHKVENVQFLRGTNDVVFESEDTVFLQCSLDLLGRWSAEYSELRINVLHKTRPIKSGFAILGGIDRVLGTARERAVNMALPVTGLGELVDPEAGQPQLFVSMFLLEHRQQLLLRTGGGAGDTAVQRPEEQARFAANREEYVDVPPGIRIFGVSPQF